MKNRWIPALVALVLVAPAAFAAHYSNSNAAAVPQASITGLNIAPAQQQLAGSEDAILYSQPQNGGNAYTAQNFESAYDIYDSFLADDITVPSSGWSIDQMIFNGTYRSSGRMPSGNIWLYTDNGGVPGSAVCTYTDMAPASDAAGVVTFSLCAAPCRPTAGHYWLAFQSNLNFLPNADQWYWWTSTGGSTPGSQALFQNPGGGFGLPCATWRPRCTNCTLCDNPNGHAFTLSTGTCQSGGGGGGSCDLTAIEGKLDVIGRNVTTILNNTNTIAANMGQILTNTETIITAVAALEAKADAEPCLIIRLLLPLIKGASLPTTHPCYVP